MLKDLELIFLIAFTTIVYVCCILLKKNNYRYLDRKNTYSTLFVVFTQFTMFLCYKYLDLPFDYYYYFPFNYFYLYILFKLLVKNSVNEKNKLSSYLVSLWCFLIVIYFIIIGFNFNNVFVYYYFFYKFSIIFILIQCLLVFIDLFKKKDKVLNITNYFFQSFIILSLVHLTFFVFSVVNVYSTMNLQIAFLTYLFIYIVFSVLSLYFLINNFEVNSMIMNNVMAIEVDKFETVNEPDKLEMKINDSLSEKYKKSKISVSDLEIIKAKLEKIENEQLYLNPELDLELLSNQFKIPKYTLSQSFGSILGTNFKDYVNTLRCNFATKLLIQEDLNYNIIEIAYQSGFNSKTSFYRAFNKIYQCSPAEYKQRIFDK